MRYVRIRIMGRGGSHVQPLNEIAVALEGVFDGAPPGTTLLLELIEMTDEEHAKLPEFMGW